MTGSSDDARDGTSALTRCHLERPQNATESKVLLYVHGGARRSDKLAPCVAHAVLCEAQRPQRLFRQVSVLKDTTDAYAYVIAGVLNKLWSEAPDEVGPPRCAFVAINVGWTEKLGDQIEYAMTTDGVAKGGKGRRRFNGFEAWRDTKALLTLSGSPLPRCPIGPESAIILRLRPRSEEYVKAAPLAGMAEQGVLELEELLVEF